MKKKIFSILFATILVLSMSLMTAVPAVAADTAAKEAAVIAAADKLVTLQNADGGFSESPESYFKKTNWIMFGDNIITKIIRMTADNLNTKEQILLNKSALISCELDDLLK